MGLGSSHFATTGVGPTSRSTARRPCSRGLNRDQRHEIWIEPDLRDFELWHREGGQQWSLGLIDEAFARLRTWLNEFHLPSLPPMHPSMQRLLDQSAQNARAASSYPSGFDRPHLGIDAYRRMQSRGRRVSMWNLLARDQQRWLTATQQQLRVIPDT